MDPSVGEKTTIINNSDYNPPLTRIIIEKVKSVVRFFSMTKEEMLQANIDLSGYYADQKQNKIENSSHSPSIVQEDERFL